MEKKCSNSQPPSASLIACTTTSFMCGAKRLKVTGRASRMPWLGLCCRGPWWRGRSLLEPSPQDVLALRSLLVVGDSWSSSPGASPPRSISRGAPAPGEGRRARFLSLPSRSGDSPLGRALRGSVWGLGVGVEVGLG